MNTKHKAKNVISNINGIVLHFKDLFYISNRGMVITATMTELPNEQTSITSNEVVKLLKGQTLLGCEIAGIEMHAVSDQSIGRSIGLLLTRRTI